MKPKRVEVWFWKQMPKNPIHWWIGVVSPKFTHCGIVVGNWKLNGGSEGSSWLPLDCFSKDCYYNQPDCIVKLFPTYAVAPINLSCLENHKSKPFPLWCHHIARDLWGFQNLKQPEWNCVDLVKRTLGWNKSHIQTPDELFKELRC